MADLMEILIHGGTACQAATSFLAGDCKLVRRSGDRAALRTGPGNARSDSHVVSFFMPSLSTASAI